MKEMRYYKRRKMRKVDPVNASNLPFDVIKEILSWLPVKSLIRFKLVCKQWYSLIDQDRKFIVKHMDRASLVQINCVYAREDDIIRAMLEKGFRFAARCAGLLLEQKLSNPQVSRIRNPATHQVLYLPSSHEGTRSIDFAFNSSTHECKAVCFYRQVGEVGFQVLTIGKDEQWRPLTYPNQDLLEPRGKPVVDCYWNTSITRAEGVGHFFQYFKNEQDWSLEIHALDILSECFCTSTLPRGFLGDQKKIWVLYWNYCVAVSERTEEGLNMLVLEDYKEDKWSKDKFSVPMKFLKGGDDALAKAQLLYIDADSDELKFHFWERIICYDLKREDIKMVKCMRLRRKQDLAFGGQHKPSLVALKGMKSKEVAPAALNE